MHCQHHSKALVKCMMRCVEPCPLRYVVPCKMLYGVCAVTAGLTSARDNLAAELQEAAAKQTVTDDQLTACTARAESLAKELQTAQQAAASAVEEAAAARQQLEQQLNDLQETQVLTSAR